MPNKSRNSKLLTTLVVTCLTVFIFQLCLAADTSAPPIAKIIPRADTLFGDVRVDNYYWLRNKADSAVINFIKAENSYTQEKTAHLKGLEDNLYNEMVARLKETDTTAAQKINDYWYYSRTEKSKQYAVFCRRKGTLSAPEEITLDINALGANQSYLNMGAMKLSPNQNYLAFAADTSGSETYTIRIKNLQTGQILPDKIEATGAEIEWANDNKTLFYETQDATLRSYRLYRHLLGSNAASDSLLFQENDEAYYLSISKTRSKKYLILCLESNTTNENWYLDADNPTGKFQVMVPRTHEVKYYIDHSGDKFYIMTDENAKNFKVMDVSTTSPIKANWHEFIAHDDSIKIEAIDAFRSFLAVYERSGGLQKIRIINLDTGNVHYIDFPDPAYTIYQTQNPVYDTPMIRFRYSSLVTPYSVYDFDMVAQKLALIKRNEVKGYDPANYRTERIFARASGGIPVPIVLVYNKDLYRGDGSNPLYLEGYGAYGISSDAEFSSSRISLLDRGFVYALAQVRGGSEMGRWWYDQGELLYKKNTFTDFIACAEHLIAQKYTSKDKLAITGGSAGGLLIGAVTNMRPDLFKVVIAQVPFVDVLNTMLDPTIPLTVTEYEEWGNPHDSTYYFYMKSYSPYDNVERKAYPAMLITGGLNDPRVAYWEPTKWTSKLRALKTDSNDLFLKINMGEGHFGVSGRYAELKDVAFEFAFCLDELGIKK
jgi:oligopeptidase B